MEKKIYSVVTSSEALAMLSEHIAFVANVNVQAAKRLREDCFSKIKSLEEMPYRCAVLEDTNFPYKKYRYLIFENYALVFVVEEESQTVYVDYILDTRQDYSWLFSEK